MQSLSVKRLAEQAKLPVVAHPGEDLGYDVFALEDVVLPLGKTVSVRTGIALQATRLSMSAIRTWEPLGLIVKDRSSMAQKGIFTRGGVIDAGYTGEIMIFMSNTNLDISTTLPSPQGYGCMGYQVKAGDKIAQLIPVPVLTGSIYEVEKFESTGRGDKGFGSSGK